MAVDSPPRKTKRVSATASAEPGGTISPNLPNPAANDTSLATNVKAIVSEILPGIIPAITQSVVTSLTQLGMIPKTTPSDPEDNQPVLTAQTSNAVDNEAVLPSQGDPAVDITKVNASNISHTEESTASPAISFSHTDLPQSKFVSMARPLCLGVDSKVKGKIWANQYVELHGLLSQKKNEKIEFVDNGDGVLICKKSNSNTIKSFDRWLEAFHTFVAIYSLKYPQETPNLMRHATIVQRLAKQAGDEAGYFTMKTSDYGVRTTQNIFHGVS